MKIFLLIVAFILLLTVVPIKFHFYFSDIQNRIIISFFGIRLYTSKKSDKKNNCDKSNTEKSENTQKNTFRKTKGQNKKNNKNKKISKENNKINSKNEISEDDGPFSKFLDMFLEEREIFIYCILKFLKAVSKLLRSVPVKKLYVKLGAGGEDAYEAAMNYAFYNEIVWGTLGFAASFLKISKKKIYIYPIFTEDDSPYRISFTANLKICDIIAVAVFLLIEYVKIIMWTKNGIKPSDEKINKIEKEFKMGENKNNKVSDLMGVTMEKIREMVDVNTIIGSPVQVNETVTIIPVSKVSYGFGSGGSDLPVKNATKELFGGGAGAGVSMKPIGFIVVQGEEVKFIQIAEEYKASNSVIDMIPGIVDTFSGIFSKDKNDNDEPKKSKKQKKAKKEKSAEKETVSEE